MKIQVYGTGCSTCEKLYAEVQQIIQHHELDVTLEKISDIEAITQAGVLMTPALAIDGKVVSAGKLPSEAEILKLIAPEHVTPCECAGEVSVSAAHRGKQAITALLFAVILASLALMLYRETHVSVQPERLVVDANTTVVYYFHGVRQCATCLKIEALTKQALEGRSFLFKSINLDDPANEHFINDFQLENRIVVLQRNGKYAKMDRVWDLVGNEPAFLSYIQDAEKKLSTPEKPVP